RRAGPALEPPPSPGTEATANPFAPLPAGAEPAPPSFRPHPRRGNRRQGPLGRGPGDDGAVGAAQPDGAVLQPAGGLAPFRPLGDGRRKESALGSVSANMFAGLAGPPGERPPVRPREAPRNLCFRRRPGVLSSGPDGPVRARGGRTPDPANHSLGSDRRQARALRRRHLHTSGLPDGSP